MHATMNFSPGLENVIAAETAISNIDGEAGKLIYEGYDATQLAYQRKFEDVWYLLLNGDLPTADQRSALIQEAHQFLDLPAATLQVITKLPSDIPFMTVLRTAVSTTLAAWNLRPTIDLSAEEIRQDCFRAAAVAPAIVAAVYRLRHNASPVTINEADSWARTYLRLVNNAEPTDDQVMALNRYLILVADHGLNASTFAARSVISTATDVGSAVVAAVGSLSGPLHGGAPSRVLEMFDDIGDVSNAQPWAREKISAGAKIMGFGHRVYKTYDPRARVLKATAHEMNARLANYAEAVEDTILQTFDELKPGRSISTNVEYWSAVVMDAAGLPPELFTPTFVVSRMVGWTAHINEQLANNRIFRPRASYIGPALRALN